tara:strand:+ start:293 stop:508 length:216 start_codon:yes stop_codon:yes gene_type:complete
LPEKRKARLLPGFLFFSLYKKTPRTYVAKSRQSEGFIQRIAKKLIAVILTVFILFITFGLPIVVNEVKVDW